jgi:AraC family cel operon transcriptional repressor
MDIIKLSLSGDDKLSEVGYLKQYSVHETFQIHTHDSYEFFYICKGKSIHEINSTSQLLVQGTLVFIRPSDIHKFSFFNQYDMQIISCGVQPWLIDSSLAYIGIKKEFFTEPALPPSIILEGTDFINMEKRLDLIGEKNAGNERKTYFLSILPELLYMFFTNDQKKNDIFPIWLTNLLTAMDEPQNFIMGLDAMIKLANFSQEHLTREFHKHLQMTPTEYINIKRINYASDLLLQQKYKIVDVCYMSGFNNLTYFYKIFHKQYNCTPKEFIKKHSDI